MSSLPPAGVAALAAATSASPSPPPFPDPDDPSAAEDDDADAPVDTPTDATAADIPLTMMASTVLQQLPRDATAALAATTAGSLFARDRKVVVRFKAVGSAPALDGTGADVRRKIAAGQRFEVVVAFVRRALRVRPGASVFLYVNSAFAPALDEVVGNLHQCFKDSHDQLNVSYSLTPAFG